MPLKRSLPIRTTSSIQKCNKNIVKKRTCFWTFLPIWTTRCCIRSPAWPTYSTPNGPRVLEYSPGPGVQHFGISVAKRAAVPALHVPILRFRIKAFGVVPSQPATSLWTAVLPTDRRQLKTCDSRADEMSSFQPILLGSHDEIMLHVHGTSV